MKKSLKAMPLFNNTLWRTATIFSKKATFENENEKPISDELIYKAMTKLNMTTELLVTGGFRVPNVQKKLIRNNHETDKGPYLQFHKLYQ